MTAGRKEREAQRGGQHAGAGLSLYDAANNFSHLIQLHVRGDLCQPKNSPALLPTPDALFPGLCNFWAIAAS